jgi:hypothetical protein
MTAPPNRARPTPHHANVYQMSAFVAEAQFGLLGMTTSEPGEELRS